MVELLQGTPLAHQHESPDSPTIVTPIRTTLASENRNPAMRCAERKTTRRTRKGRIRGLFPSSSIWWILLNTAPVEMRCQQGLTNTIKVRMSSRTVAGLADWPWKLPSKRCHDAGAAYDFLVQFAPFAGLCNLVFQGFPDHLADRKSLAQDGEDNHRIGQSQHGVAFRAKGQ